MKICVLLLACITLFADIPKLRIYQETDPDHLLVKTSSPDEIAFLLHLIDVRFEQWKANKELPQELNEAAVIEAYQADVDRLVQENGYKSVDVVRMYPDKPGKEAFRAKFLNEHTHSEDEVRFFVEGSGLFYLHAQGRVYMLLCEKNDLISIPARYTHWFDMGPEPFFTAIRFFIEPAGWVADFTGDPIAQRFPKFGE
jgi:1,2-dihydroxy-3-keto-5-methylthiopentene dioxygenase